MEDLPGALPERLSNVEIEPVSVTKLQHGSYDGITIREEGSNIGMNLDLTGLYERMEKGTAYDEVIAEAVAIITNATAQAPKIDVDRLMDYGQLKETLSIQVVPTASNEEMLQNIPHDEDFKNPVDLMFDELEKKNPNYFAVSQYKKYLLAAGKTAKSILMSCGARLAPFNIEELREITEYDELALDTLGDRKSALFLIMSDTDSTFIFFHFHGVYAAFQSPV